MSLVDLGKRLLESAKLGETEEVRILMTNGAPFTTDWLGTSPLHMAAQYGHLETAEVLLRGGISRDARTKVDRTPLHIAAQEGHHDIVELLIQNGAEVDARDMLKMTPLHWAVERGHLLVVKYLLKNNADIYAMSKFEKTALDIAGDNCNNDIIDLLVQHAATIESTYNQKIFGKSTDLNESNSIQSKHTIKKTVTPLIIKTEPQIKKAVDKIDSPRHHVSTSSDSSPGANVKTPNVSKPVFLHANLANIQKAAVNSTSGKFSLSSDSEGEQTDYSSTNVLATLAALAEATAPNASMSTAEALQWLESNGNALPTDNTSIVASAIEGGQTVALTEAGKLALTWVKQHQNELNNSSVTTSSTSSKSNENILNSTPTSTNQKVITIVADHSRLPSIISSPQTPIVVLSSQNVPVTVESSNPPVKKIKSYVAQKDISKLLTNEDITSTSLSIEDERLQLQKELEKIKKQAEKYKEQLLQKEHEAEQYRRQLEQMRTPSKVNQ